MKSQVEKSKKKNKRIPSKRPWVKTLRSLDADEVALVQANARYARAYKGIATHQKGMWLGQDLSGAFAVRACLAVLPVTHSIRWREGIWLQGTGRSWKALTEFPTRLQRVADEIENLNAKFFCISEACRNPTLVSFNRVPMILRSYAETLGRRAARIPKAFPMPRRGKWVSELSTFTMLVTGRFCDKEVAELLNGASTALDLEKDPHFDALTIAQARSRLNKKSKT
jgi:hypothetical protein